MPQKEKNEVIDVSAFTYPNAKTGNFFMDNWLMTLASIGVLFVIGFILASVIRNVGIPIILASVIAVRLFLGYTAKIGRQRQHDRLLMFAETNNFILRQDPDYVSTGVVFQAGNSDHETGEILEGKLYSLSFKIYIHSFSTSSGKSRTTHFYGVVEIDFPKTMPHIFIDSKKNNWLLGETLDIFKRHDMVELEGNFNSYFRVFAASGYDVESLTLLNPAFMQTLISKAKDFEIELIGKKGFIYLEDVVTLSKASAIKIFEAAEVLILNLQKQLDTFVFTPTNKVPNQIDKSLYKEIVSKI